ncbi:MAG: transketolase, partial [Candidatus Bathyarchaeia archaeon]
RNPAWRLRDRFLLGKGHAAPALYAVLAECGYFPEEELSKLRCIGGLLQGHPEGSIPGVDSASGSLGQCLSIANGMALAAKMRGEDYRIYVLLGDGELQEGQVWEAAMTSARHHLDNLAVIVDRNGHQLTGPTEEVKPLEPLAEKWRAFGWEVLEADGGSPRDILRALAEAEAVKGRPTVIIASTAGDQGSLERRG